MQCLITLNIFNFIQPSLSFFQLAVEGTVLGGLDAAKFVTPSSEEMETNKGLDEENLEELQMNVVSFGNVIKILLDVCPTLEKFSEVSYRMKILIFLYYTILYLQKYNVKLYKSNVEGEARINYHLIEIESE